jgi:hypothetical protein
MTEQTDEIENTNSTPEVDEKKEDKLYTKEEVNAIVKKQLETRALRNKDKEQKIKSQAEKVDALLEELNESKIEKVFANAEVSLEEPEKQKLKELVGMDPKKLEEMINTFKKYISKDGKGAIGEYNIHSFNTHPGISPVSKQPTKKQGQSKENEKDFGKELAKKVWEQRHVKKIK